jgi:hypothetical protein
MQEIAWKLGTEVVWLTKEEICWVLACGVHPHLKYFPGIVNLMFWGDYVNE